MQDAIEHVIDEYDSGKISRRDLASRLIGLAAAAPLLGGAAASQKDSTFRAVGLNHIALSTPDVSRSRDFYVRHLGLEVTRDNESSCFLSFGDNFLALFDSDSAGMHHYCYSIADYDVARVEETLEGHGLEPRREGNRIYFNDPDGNSVQLSEKGHQA